MTRPRTPAERHERELDRMVPGGDYDASAPVRRQGPKGRVRVEPIEPYSQLPVAVEEGTGAVGVAEEYAPGDHGHPLTLSALTPQPITDDPGAPGATGEVPDAGHKHHFDPVAAGIPAWDADATPDTLGLRSATGTLSVAPPSAPAHAIPNSQTSVPPTADTIGRRNSAGQMEVAPSTAGSHAVANSETSVPAAANAITRRNGSGQTEGLQVPSGTTAAPSVAIGSADTGLSRSGTDIFLSEAGVMRYAFEAGAFRPAALGVDLGLGLFPFDVAHLNQVKTDFGTAAAPGVAVGDDNTGLSGATARLDLIAGGASRVQAGSAGLRPTSAGLSLGLAGQRWGNTYSNGVIETTGTNATGPVIHAPNGAIEGADFVTPGSLFADGAAFGMRSAQHVAVTGGTGVGQGIVAGVKSGGNLRVQVESGLSYRPVAASSFDVNSDARRKVLVEGEERDHLADVLATPTNRFRRLEQAPLRPEGADERTPPTEIREEQGEEQLGWLAHNVTPDVAVLLGSESEGWEVGIAVEQMLAKLWHAFQQSHESITARLDALESR